MEQVPPGVVLVPTCWYSKRPTLKAGALDFSADKKSQGHQLIWRLDPVIYDGFYLSQVVIAGFLNHQQYVKLQVGTWRENTTKNVFPIHHGGFCPLLC